MFVKVVGVFWAFVLFLVKLVVGFLLLSSFLLASAGALVLVIPVASMTILFAVLRLIIATLYTSVFDFTLARLSGRKHP